MIDRTKNRQGLTMVELVIAMALIGILATLMTPSLGRWLSHYRIKGLARDIASCFRLAQMTAVQRNQTCGVRFDSGGGLVRVIEDSGGADKIIRTVTLSDYKARFDVGLGTSDPGFDFVDQPDDNLINVFYNTRGIPSDEDGNPLTPPGPQGGQRVFLENSRGDEGYWVEITPVGNVRYDRYKG